MPAVRTPEASRPTRRIAVSGCCLPRREIGSATSITFDFAALPCGSGLHPFTCVPACNLSVYASQWLTPRKTRYTAAWLRLCRGRHFRRLNSTRLQGATPSEPDVTLSMSSGFPVPFFQQVGIDDPGIFGSCHCGYLYTPVIRHLWPFARLSRPQTTMTTPPP
jgi:hypothetical protein